MAQENRSNECGYARGYIAKLYGTFRINGVTTPDNIRDGQSKTIASVVRVSAGLFTVTFDTGFALPEKLIYQNCHLLQAANPTVWSRAHIVRDSYSQTARTFQIQVLKATATADTADAPSDADDNDLVTFQLKGSLESIGTDNVT